MVLPALNPLGSLAAFAVEAPMRKQQPTKQVTGANPSGSATGDSRQHPEQETSAAAARDVAALRREVQLRGLPAGPPPAFQITLLEAEGGLQQALARLETARAQERDAPAVRLDQLGEIAHVPVSCDGTTTTDSTTDREMPGLSRQAGISAITTD